MCIRNLLRNTIAILAAGLLSMQALHAQQNIISQKDNTRPEVTDQFSSPALVTGFSAIRNNGINEIRWTSRGEMDTRKFIVEYSRDGRFFETAGEQLATPEGVYLLKHHTLDPVAMLYRVKVEEMNGKSSYSASMLLGGADISPVKIYPTMITGQVVNVITVLPVERINVINGSGQQVYSQDINGREEFMAINIPALAKGYYHMQFVGQGWKTSKQFIIP